MPVTCLIRHSLRSGVYVSLQFMFYFMTFIYIYNIFKPIIEPATYILSMGAKSVLYAKWCINLIFVML